MSNNIIETLTNSWGTIVERDLPEWVNDQTRLNAANINNMRLAIVDLRGLKANCELLRDSVISIAKKWDDNDTYAKALALAKGLTVTEAATFNSDINANGDITVAKGKDIKLGDTSITNVIETVTNHTASIAGINTNLSTIDTSITDMQKKLSTVGSNTETRLSGVETIITNYSSVLEFLQANDSSLMQLLDMEDNVESITTNVNSLATKVTTNENSIKSVQNTLKDYSSLVERVTKLEKMIAAGTSDPENANLDENTVYYIKYED